MKITEFLCSSRGGGGGGLSSLLWSRRVMVAYNLLFLALLGYCNCFTMPHKPADPIIGQECDPPRGFARRICGRQTVINSSSVSVPDFLYGPNVCRISEEVVSNVLRYEFKNYCNYVLHHYQYYYQCTPFCMPTGTCSSMNRTLVRHSIECCEGFTPRKSFGDELSQHYEYLYDFYYVPATEQLPMGCPVAQGETVSECMNLLGLSMFRNLFDSSTFSGINDTALTFFVPTNEALDSLMGLTDEQLETFVGNHILNRTVKLRNLTLNGQFLTLSGGRLRSTAVVFADRSLAQYSPGYSYASGSSSQKDSSVRHTNIRFISGARVVNPDACESVNITLHVIDRALMPAQMTLADILEGLPQLSRFRELLEFANILQFLAKEDGESRTIFAPTNDVFDEQIPPDLFTCLMYRRLPLHDIALYHVLGSAEYSSSLAFQAGVHTLQLNAIRVSVTDSNNITLMTDPVTSVVDADMPASNGVLHIIDRVLIPPNFNPGSCASFVPTEPPMTSSMVAPSPATPSQTMPMLVATPTESVLPTPLSMSTGIGNVVNNP